MALKTRNHVVLTQLESKYGTFNNPVSAVLCRELSIDPLQADSISRDLIDGKVGAQPHLLTRTRVAISMTVELAGSGKAGVAPVWGTLLEGCAMSKTSITSGGARTEYRPLSSGEKSLSFSYYVDGILHRVQGCRGTFSISIREGEIPTIAFEFLGLADGSPIAYSNPSVNTNAWWQPHHVSQANTPTLTLAGYNAVASEFSLDIANSNSLHDWINRSEVIFSGREPTGSITMEAPKLADKDYFTPALRGTQSAFRLVHGSKAGHIVQLDAPNVQVLSPQYGDADGIVTLQASLRFIPDAGNDEITITTR